MFAVERLAVPEQSSQLTRAYRCQPVTTRHLSLGLAALTLPGPLAATSRLSEFVCRRPPRGNVGIRALIADVSASCLPRRQPAL